MPDPDAYAATVFMAVSSNNSSYEYYIEPRIKGHIEQTILVRPFCKDLFRALAVCEARGERVDLLISRYIDSNILNAIDLFKPILNSVRYFIDDDLRAMICDRSVPLQNKFRPAQTEYYVWRNPNLFDRIYTSTAALAKVLSKRHQNAVQPTCWPPIGVIFDEPSRPINPHQLYYFAKMHGPEHAFLWPIITELLKLNPQAKFDVIANGAWARKWSAVEGVTVHPEMTPVVYKAFVRSLPAGGLFLLPLTDSKLNHSRSDTKLFEVINTGSVAIAGQHPVYNNAPVTHFKMSPDIWQRGILEKMNSSKLEIERKTLYNYLIGRNANFLEE